MKKILNLNQTIFVKLTPAGMQVYNRYFDEKMGGTDFEGKFDQELAKETNKEGYTEFQVWRFMRIFGSDMVAGGVHLFEGNNIFK